MSDEVVFESRIPEEGELTVRLSPEVTRGPVTIRVWSEEVDQHTVTFVSVSAAKEEIALAYPRPAEGEPGTVEAVEVQEGDDAILAELTDEYLDGLGLTAGEILKSPEIGVWADREDMADSAAYVAAMRRRLSQRYKHLWE